MKTLAQRLPDFLANIGTFEAEIAWSVLKRGFKADNIDYFNQICPQIKLIVLRNIQLLLEHMVVKPQKQEFTLQCIKILAARENTYALAISNFVIENFQTHFHTNSHNLLLVEGLLEACFGSSGKEKRELVDALYAKMNGLSLYDQNRQVIIHLIKSLDPKK